MRRLSLSLLLLVLVAIIGAGWAIDRLFSRLDTTSNDSLQHVRELGLELAHVLDTQTLSSATADTTQNNPAQSNPTQANPAESNQSAANPIEPSADRPSFESPPNNTVQSLNLIQRDELSLPDSLQQSLDAGTPLTLESSLGVSLYFKLPRSNQVLAINLAEPKPLETPLRLLLTVLFYGAIILLVLLWLYPLIRRLQSLAVTAKAFGEGDLQQRVTTNPRSHLYDIESEFNHMARRIQGLVTDNKLLSSAVSHDLRTPLARLRFGIDALREIDDATASAAYLDRISADLTEMEQLVEVLLEFARLDQQLHELPLQSVDLNELLEHATQVVSDTSDHDVNWQASAHPTLVAANPRYASMMINNILQNAIRYGHSRIQVSTNPTRDHILLIIEDDGPGIPIEDREAVLKPFVRKTEISQNSLSSKGFGLGLAIVNRIAQWHDAELELSTSTELGGARVQLAFKSAATLDA